ncbi:MAG: hypothetical protein ABI047_11155 [Jatrophihabitantaceae bacterium]
MDNNNPGEAETAVRTGGLGVKLGLVAASLAVGAIGATAIAAGAETSSPATPSASASASPTAPTDENGAAAGGASKRGHGGGHGSAPVRSDEKAVTAAQEAALKAAALKAVPGGTVYRVETDGDGDAFEAHMTKADGTEVTVKFDAKLAVTGVEDGMGKGGPDSDGD